MHTTSPDTDDALLRIDVTSDEGRLDLVLTGELDLDSGTSLERVLHDDDGARPVHLDLSGVTFVDLAGIRGLLRLVDSGREVRLCQPSDRVRRTFELADLEHLLEPSLRSCRAAGAAGDGPPRGAAAAGVPRSRHRAPATAPVDPAGSR